MLIQKYKKENWGLTNVNWEENDIQAGICTALFRLEKAGFKFTFAGDQNGANRGRLARMIAKACGLRSGETDLRFYLPKGELALVELKRLKKGRVDPDQIKRHRLLESLGFEVQVVFADSPLDGIHQVLKHLARWIEHDYAELIAIALREGTEA